MLLDSITAAQKNDLADPYKNYLTAIEEDMRKHAETRELSPEEKELLKKIN